LDTAAKRTDINEEEVGALSSFMLSRFLCVLLSIFGACFWFRLLAQLMQL
jgi:hypothetical protein